MMTRDEIYLLIRIIERTYQCRVCIIDGDGNYLFSTNFPEIDTAHLGELCRWCAKLHLPYCRDCDDLAAGQHAETVKTAFYKICPYGCMEIVGSVSLPGVKRFQIFAGIFKPRSDLPENALVFSQKMVSPFDGHFRELSDAEFAELPVLWNMLIREITLFFEKKMVDDKLPPDPKDVITDYINGRFRKNISLSELAAKLGWSDSHTTVRIRKMFGKTFVRMLNERRIENAKWLLRNKYQMPVSGIAKVSGFRSGPYFYRIFSRFTGMTPMEYRNSGKKSSDTPEC